MNKKGFEIKAAFFGIVIVSMVAIAAGVMIDEWNTAYNRDLTSSDLDSYNNLQNISSIAQEQQGLIAPKSSQSGEQFEDTTLRGIFGIVATLHSITSGFGIIFGSGGMVDAVAQQFSLPPYVKNAVIALIIIAITMAVIAVIFRLPRRSA